MNILFLDQKDPVIGNVTVQDPHHVLIENTEKNLSGFHLVTDEGNVYGKYDNLYNSCTENRGKDISCPMMAVYM